MATHVASSSRICLICVVSVHSLAWHWSLLWSRNATYPAIGSWHLICCSHWLRYHMKRQQSYCFRQYWWPLQVVNHVLLQPTAYIYIYMCVCIPSTNTWYPNSNHNLTVSIGLWLNNEVPTELRGNISAITRSFLFAKFAQPLDN